MRFVLIFVLWLFFLTGCEQRASSAKLFSCQGFSETQNGSVYRVSGLRMDSVQMASGNFVYSLNGKVYKSGKDLPFSVHFGTNPILRSTVPAFFNAPLQFENEDEIACAVAFKKRKKSLIEITWSSGNQRIFLRTTINGAH